MHIRTQEADATRGLRKSSPEIGTAQTGQDPGSPGSPGSARKAHDRSPDATRSRPVHSAKKALAHKKLQEIHEDLLRSSSKIERQAREIARLFADSETSLDRLRTTQRLCSKSPDPFRGELSAPRLQNPLGRYDTSPRHLRSTLGERSGHDREEEAGGPARPEQAPSKRPRGPAGTDLAPRQSSPSPNASGSLRNAHSRPEPRKKELRHPTFTNMANAI